MMIDEEPVNEGPGEHDAHLMDDDPSEQVPCARCGESIWAYAQRCPACGVYFSGEAWQFQPAGPKATGRLSWWHVLVVGLIVAALLMWWW